MNFSEFRLEEALLKGIEDASYTECLPVQEATLKESLKPRDVCVQSQTGSGKTAAFMVTIYQRLLTEMPHEEKKALVIAPTRELAVQIGKEAGILGRHTGIKNCVIYGGGSYTVQERQLDEGARIIIATPGRLIDFITQRKIDPKQFYICVIDEADRLFDMGFLPDIRRILKKLPAASKRQTMLFSATLGYRARELSWEHMNEAVEIELSPETVTVESVSQALYHVSADEKFGLLLGILKKESPKSAIIFTNTKDEAVKVAQKLEINNQHCEYIIGDLPQKKRLKLIDGLKRGSIKILVATNVASRGLHVDDLSLVLNYDLPEDPEDYVHRIGRTARVGKEGKAITLACDRFVHSLEAIEELIGMKIPVEWPEEDLIIRDYVIPARSNRRKIIAGKPYVKGEKPLRGKGSSASEKGKAQRKNKTEHAQARANTHKKEMHPEIKLSSGQSIDERLDYYSRKYGELFRIKE